MRRGPLIVALLLPLSVKADGPVLHERAPNLSDREISTLVSIDGTTPVGLVYGGRVLEAPEAGATPGADELVIQALPDAAGGGSITPTFRPDRQTSLDERATYFEVFTPGVTPFKRGTALDAVRLGADGVPTLTVADPSPVDVPVIGVGPDEPSRTRFWGSVVLDFRGGRRAQLPSVSPESRILSVQVEPAVGVRFERDSADNLFVVADDPPPSPVRLTFLTDAPKSYFNAELPEVPADVLASHVAPLPPTLRRAALGFAHDLGIERGDMLPFALGALVEHFRSFGESEQPEVDTGDIYLDLARGGVGVCRHRAYAFVITAHALGIPARYVQNEAHAWVEVELGDVGFMRVDLGGAAVGLDARGLADRPLYHPELPDPLPRPPAYEQAMSRGRPGRTGGPASAAPFAPPAPEPEERAEPETPDARQRLRVQVDRQLRRAYRGRAIDLRGRVLGPDGKGVAGLRVEVLLEGRREGEGGESRTLEPTLLGVTVTHERGWFQGTFGLPVALDVGDYRLRVRTPGSAAYAPAEAR